MTGLAHIGSPQYTSAYKRLDTFQESLIPHIDAIELAECGFFYIGSNCVKCFACSIEFVNLRIKNGIMASHYQESRRCPFLQGYYVGNEPIKCDPTRGPTRRVPSVDISGVPKKKVEHPLHKQWVTYDKRLHSFDPSNNWCECKVDKKQLAAAGFFNPSNNKEYEDTVLCFSCGMNLCMWKEGDDPWAIHKEVSPHCRFVKLHKEHTNLLDYVTKTISPHKSDDDKYSCKVCMNSDINCFIRPCNHCLCSLCASSLSECPLCKQKIDDVEKMFM